MKKTKLILIIPVFLILLASSCTNRKVEEVICVGGAPGNLTIKVYLQHNEHILVNLKNYRDTIYVKYNTLEFPGTDPASYDATYIGEYQHDNVPLTNLKCGKYYLYAVGMESTHFVRISGGMPCSVEQGEGEVSVTIQVSE